MMVGMVLGLFILLLLSLNIGGITSAALRFGQQDFWGGLGTFLVLGVLDAIGFRLLQEMRGR